MNDTWVPQPPALLTGLDGKLTSEAVQTFLTFMRDDYSRDYGPIGVSFLSLDDLIILRFRSESSIKRDIRALLDAQAIERQKRRDVSKTRLNYELFGLPSIGPVIDPREVISDPSWAFPKAGQVSSDPSRQVSSGLSQPTIVPLRGAIQPALPVSVDHLRWQLAMSPGDILRLRTRHPGVDIEGRWRQWLEWVAADIPSRMPKDKHGAFYG